MAIIPLNVNIIGATNYKTCLYQYFIGVKVLGGTLYSTSIPPTVTYIHNSVLKKKIYEVMIHLYSYSQTTSYCMFFDSLYVLVIHTVVFSLVFLSRFVPVFYLQRKSRLKMVV